MSATYPEPQTQTVPSSRAGGAHCPAPMLRPAAQFRGGGGGAPRPQPVAEDRGGVLNPPGGSPRWPGAASRAPRALMALWPLPAGAPRSRAPYLVIFGEQVPSLLRRVRGARTGSANASARPAPRASDWLGSRRPPRPPRRRRARASAQRPAPRAEKVPRARPRAGGAASRRVFLVSPRVQATVFPCAPACGARLPLRAAGHPSWWRRRDQAHAAARPGGRASSDPAPSVPAGGRLGAPTRVGSGGDLLTLENVLGSCLGRAALGLDTSRVLGWDARARCVNSPLDGSPRVPAERAEGRVRSVWPAAPLSLSDIF